MQTDGPWTVWERPTSLEGNLARGDVAVKHLVFLFLFSALWPELSTRESIFAAEQANSHRLVGKFQKAQPKYSKIAPDGVFFVIVTEKGETLAFPVTFKNAVEKKRVMAALDKTYAVQGERTQMAVVSESGEGVQRVYVLALSEVDQVALSELRPKISSTSEVEQAGKPMEKPTAARDPKPRSPGVSGVNDTATNAVIFTAGAVLLGSILSN